MSDDIHSCDDPFCQVTAVTWQMLSERNPEIYKRVSTASKKAQELDELHHNMLDATTRAETLALAEYIARNLVQVMTELQDARDESDPLLLQYNKEVTAQIKAQDEAKNDKPH